MDGRGWVGEGKKENSASSSGSFFFFFFFHDPCIAGLCREYNPCTRARWVEGVFSFFFSCLHEFYKWRVWHMGPPGGWRLWVCLSLTAMLCSAFSPSY